MLDGAQIYIGGCELLVQGSSNAADHLGFEYRESEFYTALISKIMPASGQSFPFSEGTLVACFDVNGKLMLSKGITPWTSEAKYIVTIGGLGHQRSGSGDPTADVAKTFARIKDS